jgi:hypothetical protein
MTDWPVLRLEEDNDRLRERVARLTAALAALSYATGAMQYCARCAGTGEYPPTDGDVCSTCHGEGEFPVPAVPEPGIRDD